MKEAVLIQEISLSELRELLQGLVQRENEELRREVVQLRQDLAGSRGVITLKQATTYFVSYVKPETILSYIHYEGLPAAKRGRLWFIYVQDLLDWQIGFIGHLSTKKQGVKKVIAPRHRRNKIVKSSAERAPVLPRVGAKSN
ncbi:MAG: hypothetical protein BMS9Abin05_1957 [Rhodothermia bacterium]|nr:MAG: hypothetical protein BMS9Abin05_1957 [Rhodothermia bacterium]